MNTILLLLLVAIIAWAAYAFNRIIRLRNQVRAAWADVDVQLKRRHDLVPQLVAAVQGYAGHERSVLAAVTELRARAMDLTSPAGLGEVESGLERALSRLFALKEAYPDLKASTNFLQLQRDLVDVEEQLQFARRFYNGAVRDYNTTIQKLPDLAVARVFQFEDAEFFQARDEERAAVGVGHAGPLVLLAFIAGAGLLWPLPAMAQERIRAYDIDVEVLHDGVLEVTERITVRAEGQSIRRGIYRDFPTRYLDGHGNRVKVGLEVLGVERDGRPEAWFTERVSNGVRINTGDDAFLPTLPADYTFTLRYRTTRQLGFFAEHDELYWNAIGTGWIFPIERGTVTVRLPEPVPVTELGVEAYTGPQGARGTAYSAATPAAGTATYTLTSPLAPREAFTIVLTFPKGVVPEPTKIQRAGWLLRDNAGILVALVGLILLLVYSGRTWWRVGRDPRPGIIIPRYQPPKDQTPAAIRYLGRMGYDLRCFSADLLALAVGRHVRIHQEGRRGSRWRLERTDPPTPVPATSPGLTASTAASETVAPPHPLHRPLLQGLFPAGKRELKLRKQNATTVQAARDAHSRALDTAMHPRYFKRNAGRATIAFVLTIATAFLAFGASDGAGIFAIILIIAVMAVVSIIFTSLVKAPTEAGRELLDEIEGLKLYLSVAERDELAGLAGPAAESAGSPPPLDADRYEALLPYAVALEVEEAWTKKFTAAVGAAAVAAATQRMAWYSGTGRATDLTSFTRSIGSSLTSSIASASSPPGSSSGSGGGGSSGGGGGGGGGGGR